MKEKFKLLNGKFSLIAAKKHFRVIDKQEACIKFIRLIEILTDSGIFIVVYLKLEIYDTNNCSRLRHVFKFCDFWGIFHYRFLPLIQCTQGRCWRYCLAIFEGGKLAQALIIMK